MTLDDFETLLGAKLPDDYREFLQTHHQSQLPHGGEEGQGGVEFGIEAVLGGIGGVEFGD